MPVVAVCPVHGAFESRAIQLENATDVVLSGNVESCPQCGRLSRVMDGTYNFDTSGVAQVLAAPAWSRLALRQVQSEVRRLANAAENPELSDDMVQQIATEVAARIASHDERVAEMVLSGIRDRPRHAAIAFLLALITVLGMIDGAVGGARVTYDAVEKIVNEVFG